MHDTIFIEIEEKWLDQAITFKWHVKWFNDMKNKIIKFNSQILPCNISPKFSSKKNTF